MKLTYTFKHLDHSDALQEYTEQRMIEIGRFLLKDGAGNVYYSKQKGDFCVEISVNTPDKYFKATSYGPDIYAAVDAVVDKLERQFLKNTKQRKYHKKPELSKEGRLDRVLRYRKAA